MKNMDWKELHVVARVAFRETYERERGKLVGGVVWCRWCGVPTQPSDSYYLYHLYNYFVYLLIPSFP